MSTHGITIDETGKHVKDTKTETDNDSDNEPESFHERKINGITAKQWLRLNYSYSDDYLDRIAEGLRAVDELLPFGYTSEQIVRILGLRKGTTHRKIVDHWLEHVKTCAGTPLSR